MRSMVGAGQAPALIPEKGAAPCGTAPSICQGLEPSGFQRCLDGF